MSENTDPKKAPEPGGDKDPQALRSLSASFNSTPSERQTSEDVRALTNAVDVLKDPERLNAALKVAQKAVDHGTSVIATVKKLVANED